MALSDRAAELQAKIQRGKTPKLLFCSRQDARIEWDAIRYDSGQAADMIRRRGETFVAVAEPGTTTEAWLCEIMPAVESEKPGPDQDMVRTENEALRGKLAAARSRINTMTEIAQLLRQAADRDARRVFDNLVLAIDLPDTWWRRRDRKTLEELFNELSVDTNEFRQANGIGVRE